MGTAAVMSNTDYIALAWMLELAFGWPDTVYRVIRHPVVWIGCLITWFDRNLNRQAASKAAQFFGGAVTCAAVTAVTVVPSLWLGTAAQQSILAQVISVFLGASLIASRSLFSHVAAVAGPLGAGDLGAAKKAVSMIVGRQTGDMDEAAVARASLESLAENMSDGVTAPLFWGALFGLPGLVFYKAVNTLDSMIGHKSERYLYFGKLSARLDDIVNWVPARLTGALLCLADANMKAAVQMWRDAPRHRSPNAGWPEAAMAGVLDVRLSGPRRYGTSVSNEPWLNGTRPDPVPRQIFDGLRLYQRGLALLATGMIAAVIWGRIP